MNQKIEIDEQDEEYFAVRKFEWEIIEQHTPQGQRQLWLLIHNFPIPAGYNTPQATAAIQFPENGDYLRQGLDMVYFFPHLNRLDGKPINRTEGRMSIGDKEFQRWSRHRTAGGSWQSGHDCLTTHVLLIEHWLIREFS